MLENCPICKSSNTKISRDGFSKKKNAGSNYLKGINQLKNIKSENLYKKIPLLYCSDCGTGWRGDSDLSKNIDRIYHTKHSLHWKSFQLFRDFIKGNKQNTHLESISKLINLMSMHLNKKLDLIEIGSPLHGFGFFYANPKLIKNIFSHSRKTYGLEQLLLLQEKLTNIQIILFKFSSKLKLLIKSFFREKLKKNKISNNENDINEIMFYDIPTSIGWGASSIICGQSTLKWLLNLNPNIKLINKYNVKNQYSDITICINYLDHFDAPIEIIKEILQISKCIIFNIHKQNDAGIQHKYTFSENLAKVITKYLPNDKICKILSNDIVVLNDYKGYNYFIAGEKDLVLNYINYLKYQK